MSEYSLHQPLEKGTHANNKYLSHSKKYAIKGTYQYNINKRNRYLMTKHRDQINHKALRKMITRLKKYK
jgi:hypothetical protein